MARSTEPIMTSLCRGFDMAVSFLGLFLFVLLFPVATVIDYTNLLLGRWLAGEVALRYARYLGAFVLSVEVAWIVVVSVGFSRQPEAHAVSLQLAISIPVGGTICELILAWFTAIYAILISTLVIARWCCDFALYSFWRAPITTALCVGGATRNWCRDKTATSWS